ncbi:MAG: 3-deoxy-manno-octulosonate cytidylyltransferase [Ignavibacteriaceae bacterium]
MVIGIIPARFASTRLLGKPLADIGGKPMIRHTYERALKSRLLEKVVIAVDDLKVEQVVKSFGAEVYMTPKNIKSGSDRIALVAKSLKDASIIVNIQGDEPFLSGEMIDQAIEPLLFDTSISVSTLAKKIESVAELKSPSVVKVVFDYNNFALYFSRSPIPFIREAKTNFERINLFDVYKHLGLYVFKKDALLKFATLPQTDLEKAEKLEQLRMLEHGMKIKIVVTGFESFSVDTPDDLEKARAYYKMKLKEGQNDS